MEKNAIMSIDKRETARTQARYQRIAPLYDAMELFAERRYADWQPRLWSLVQGSQVLEVGVGTGKNIPYYPDGVEVTAIDLTLGMLERAKSRAAELNVAVDLQLGDVQALDFPDETFDDVAATFVFCSVPDPVLGFDEIVRVLKPNGRLHLLEHVRSPNPILGAHAAAAAVEDNPCVFVRRKLVHKKVMSWFICFAWACSKSELCFASSRN